MNDRWVLRVLLAATCGAGSLSAQQDVEAGRHGSATAPQAAPKAAPSAAAPRMAARTNVAPPRAEHGFVNDVEAGRVLGGTSSKPDANGPDPGKPVEIAPHAQCQFDISVRPSKLLAGQTGTAMIIMVLEGDSVLESAADLRIVLPEDHDAEGGLLTMGPATIGPPRPAKLAAAYRGRQVYDNWAVVELPITMSPSAPSGSLQSLGVEALFRLHEGSTGRLFGEFRNPLAITCEVGAVPDPAVRRVSTDARTATTELAAEPQGSTPVERARIETESPAAVAAPDRDPIRPAPLGDLPPTPDSGTMDSGMLLLIGAGGLFALAMLALFLRRR